MNNNDKFHGTTIVGVRRGKEVVVGGDGQVTLGNTVMKNNAKKVRRLYKDNVIAGFAGATADAFTLFEKFEGKLEKYSGHLTRSAVELAKDWRMDKMLRHLDAMLVVMSDKNSFIIAGDGNVIEPDGQVVAIGSGGGFAQAAALALISKTKLSAKQIAFDSLKIAAELCIYTNDSISVLEIK